MRKLILPFALIGLILCCLSILLLDSCSGKSNTCSKTVSCPAYDGTILDDWFPYHNKRKITFKDSANNYEIINLQQADSTAPYSYPAGGFSSSDHGCSGQKSFFTITTKDVDTNYISFNITLSNRQDAYSTTITKSVLFSFGSSYFNGASITENGVSSFTLEYPGNQIYNVIPKTFNNFTLNGFTYSIAQSITNDSVLNKNLPGVYEVTYAKGAGIVEFKVNPGNITWIKQ